MSLFKALSFNGFSSDIDSTTDLFVLTVEDIAVEDGVPLATTEQITGLLSVYIECSVEYLRAAAQLSVDPTLDTQLKFMNSYLAEALRGAGLHYFHQEGMTIIDLLLQKTLDKGDFLENFEIEAIVQDVEDSHIEEDEDEIEED